MSNTVNGTERTAARSKTATAAGSRMLRRRIILGAAASGLLIIAVVALMVRQTYSVLEGLQQRVKYDEQMLEQCSALYASGLQMGQATRNIILNPSDTKAAANHQAAWGEVTTALNVAGELTETFVPGNTQQREQLRALSALMTEDEQLQMKAQAMARNNDRDGAVAFINTQETKRWRDAKKIILAMRDSQRAKMEADLLVLAAETERMWYVLSGSVLMLLAMIGVACVYFLRNVVTPIGQVASALHHADIHSTLQSGRTDEIGELEQAFDSFVADIRSTLERVSATSVNVVHAGRRITAATDQLSHGAAAQSSQTAEVSDSMDRMAGSMEAMSQQAESAVRAAADAEESARHGGTVVNSTIEGMQRIAVVVNNSASQIKALGASSDRIGEIIGVIDEIADQTNLLALNAAIEAARAGDQGRGFAVVADEVRKLAERTSRATKEIAGMIRQIQTDTGNAVSSMDEGTREVGEGIVRAENAGTVLSGIVEKAHSVADAVQSIVGSSGSQTEAGRRVSDKVKMINEVTRQVESDAVEIAGITIDLNNESEELQQLLGKFSLGAGASAPHRSGKKEHRDASIPKSSTGTRSTSMMITEGEDQ